MNKFLNIFNSNLLLSLVYINYLLYFFFETKLFFIFFGLVLVINFFFILYSNLRVNFYLVLLVLIICLISLGSPAIDWDARSIWLFNAKRIFYNKNLSDYINYTESEFSHLDYPILIQTFSASLAELIGNWNDIFPKISSIIFALPALVVISKIIDTKFEKFIFIVLILFIYEKKIINGEMDALLGLYSISCVVLIINFYKNKKKSKSYYLTLVLHLIALTMIKIEGIAIFFSLLISFFITFYNFKIKSHNYLVTLFLLSLIPLVLWKNYVNSQNILSSSHLMISNGERFLENITDFKFILILIEGIILNKQMFISFLIFIIAVSKYVSISEKNSLITIKSSFFKNEILFIIFAILFYSSILFIIFVMSENSPNNIFEIKYFMTISSSSRLFLPIHSLLIICSIYLNKKNLNSTLIYKL